MALKNRISAALRAFGDPEAVLPKQDIERRVAEAVKAEFDERMPSASELKAQDEAGIRLAAIDRLELGWKKAVPRWDRVRTIAETALKEAGVGGGRMLEIGGRRNPRNKDFPGFEYHALDLEDAPGANGVTVAVGDITNCPHIPDGSYDFIFSFDVFEHVDKPWLAASEIIRLLRPGGVTMHSTLFSWRYHPCPIDYWRFTAPGLASIFDGLETLHSDFDYTERRRNILGQGGNAVKPDAIGGWRENVRVNYAGRKPG